MSDDACTKYAGMQGMMDGGRDGGVLSGSSRRHRDHSSITDCEHWSIGQTGQETDVQTINVEGNFVTWKLCTARNRELNPGNQEANPRLSGTGQWAIGWRTGVGCPDNWRTRAAIGSAGGVDGVHQRIDQYRGCQAITNELQSLIICIFFFPWQQTPLA